MSNVLPFFYGGDGDGPVKPSQLNADVNEPNIEEGERKMSTPSRDEIAAKLEAAEARTEARIANLSGSIDVRFVTMDHKLDKIVDSLGGLASKIDGVKADNKFTRWTIVGIFVGATVAALAALYATQANMLASFSAGLTALQVKVEGAKAESAKVEGQGAGGATKTDGDKAAAKKSATGR
jgi:hypothetical protein